MRATLALCRPRVDANKEDARSVKLFYAPGACSLAPHVVLEWIGRADARVVQAGHGLGAGRCNDCPELACQRRV